MEYEGNNMALAAKQQAFGSNVGYAPPQPKKLGAVMGARETVAQIHNTVNEIRAAAAKCADRLLGGVPEPGGGEAQGSQVAAFCGESGDLHDALYTLMRSAEAALEEVRRFERL